ncbi:MAG: energy-coupling factor transporter ATPase [Bacillota bacterium]
MPVHIDHLTHIYMPGTPYEALAVDDVTLSVQDGELFGLIGHTGSGKSTLIQHINGLLKPTKGSVHVNGIEVSAPKIARKKLIATVGLVFQYPEYQLFEETVYKDIAFGPTNLGLDEEEVERRVQEAARLIELDLALLRDKSPFELSGGEKRKVALCGVIAMRPPVLILDEPIAGLDPRGRDSILRLIRQLKEDGGFTVIMVSHSMDDVARLCSRIGVMHNGRIVKTGTPGEIFREQDMLEDLGLDVPQIRKLAKALSGKGIEIPPDVFNVEDFCSYFVERVRGKC